MIQKDKNNLRISPLDQSNQHEEMNGSKIWKLNYKMWIYSQGTVSNVDIFLGYNIKMYRVFKISCVSLLQYILTECSLQRSSAMLDKQLLTSGSEEVHSSCYYLSMLRQRFLFKGITLKLFPSSALHRELHLSLRTVVIYKVASQECKT